MRHVTILGYRKVLGTSLTIPMEMLNAADLMRRIRGHGQPPLQLQLVNPVGGNLQLTAGLELVCHSTLADVGDTDLILLPALWGNPLGSVRQNHELLHWLRQRSATPICAVGTGSYFLAEAGLLDSKVATTHWYYFDQFASEYPRVLLQRDRFITRAGNLYCAGSVNSVRDVMLYFIEQHYGQDIANAVSRHFTHELKRSYSTGLLNLPPQHVHQDEVIAEIQQWLHHVYPQKLDLPGIARRFGLSVRTLSRRFQAATGRSPMQYLQQVRLDVARDLLRSSNLAVAEVAFQCGFHDSNHFGLQFRRQMSLSPSAYRHMVRRKLFEVSATTSAG